MDYPSNYIRVTVTKDKIPAVPKTVKERSMRDFLEEESDDTHD